MQNAFETNNLVRPDLTLFDSDSSEAVFGNLLTLPIGDEGLLYVEPLYVRSSGEGGFPLLQKVLVNFGDRIGYANTLSEALDQVFGAGAGESATDSNDIADTVDEDATPDVVPEPIPDPEVPVGGAGTGDGPGDEEATPEMADAVSDINAALSRLADAQRSGDFAAQGQALAELQQAVEAYQQAQAAEGGD